MSTSSRHPLCIVMPFSYLLFVGSVNPTSSAGSSLALVNPVGLLFGLIKINLKATGSILLIQATGCSGLDVSNGALHFNSCIFI